MRPGQVTAADATRAKHKLTRIVQMLVGRALRVTEGFTFTFAFGLTRPAAALT